MPELFSLFEKIGFFNDNIFIVRNSTEKYNIQLGLSFDEPEQLIVPVGV
jgi:hypothetical protein